MTMNKILLASHLATLLVGMCLAAIIGAKMAQEPRPDPAPAILDSYNKGRSDALKIRRGNVDLELTCAALWQSKEPFLGEQQ